MGKNLKGKELGKGISQRKDGLYTGRFVDKDGKRQQKYFKKLSECRQWLATAQLEDEQAREQFPTAIHKRTKIKLDDWFEIWLKDIKGLSIRDSTRQNYCWQYQDYISPLIGQMYIQDIKPLHVQQVLTAMSDKYSFNIINSVKIQMHDIFQNAEQNDLISKNPVTKNVKAVSTVPKNPRIVLTQEEEWRFSEAAESDSLGNHFLFVLQTGLRGGELNGLKWSDINLEKRCLNVNRTMFYDSVWIEHPPKTQAGYRTIPLTDEAMQILEDRKFACHRSGLEDFVFLSSTGNHVKRETFGYHLSAICKKAQVPYVSMHELRHTFATRCIEAGMNPKTLQSIMGHASISVTMDMYVHSTNEEKEKEVWSIQDKISTHGKHKME